MASHSSCQVSFSISTKDEEWKQKSNRPIMLSVLFPLTRPRMMHNPLIIAATVVVLSCYCCCCCCQAFSASSSGATTTTNKRVFVSTPVSKYPKRLVKDCMTTAPLVLLTPEMSVDESIALLLSRGLSGAPVVDNTKDQRLVGMLTSFDFLQQEAFEGVLLPMEGSLEHVEMYVQAAQRICGQQVADVMTYNPEKTTMDTSMRAAAALMTRNRLHRLPVVDTNRDGRLVGILSCSNVMKDLLHIVRTLPPAPTGTTTSEPPGDDGDDGKDNEMEK